MTLIRLTLSATLLYTSLASPLSAATVDGATLHWSSTGHGKSTVIFVHGWTCDARLWSEQVPVIARRYRVVTLDLPGHGQSGIPKDSKFSMDLFARAVEAVRRAAKADRAVLVGHSMGALVIREYARRYPSRVVGLVLVDGVVTVGTLPPQPGPMNGPEGMKIRESIVRSMFTPTTPPVVQRRVLEMMLAPAAATANGAMLAIYDASSWRDHVMTMPVLGIYADKSRLEDFEYSRKIFPAFEYVEISGTGHFLMMEKPEEFNRLLLAFLSRVRF